MNPLHQELIQIGTRILSLCRSELYLSMRYLDLALSALSYDLNLQTRTIATDGVHLFYNPNYLIHSYEDDPVAVNRMYLHMILHCIFRHMTQAEQRDPEDWNLACDIAVESVIDSMTYSCVQRLVTDHRQKYYDSLSVSVFNAEQIYAVLIKMTYSQKIGMRREFTVDDHHFWEELQDDKERPQQTGSDSSEGDTPPPPDKDEVEQKWQDISQKTQTSMETIQRDISLMAGNLRQQLQIENRQRYDYRSFLRRFAVMREEVRVDPDSFDYGFYNYSMQLYHNMPMLEELEYRESKKFAILSLRLIPPVHAAENSSNSFWKKLLRFYWTATVFSVPSTSTSFNVTQAFNPTSKLQIPSIFMICCNSLMSAATAIQTFALCLIILSNCSSTASFCSCKGCCFSLTAWACIQKNVRRMMSHFYFSTTLMQNI